MIFSTHYRRIGMQPHHKWKKLCTQSRENPLKVGSTLILPATCISLNVGEPSLTSTHTCSLAPAVLGRTPSRFTEPAPYSWRRTLFPGPMLSSRCCRMPWLHDPFDLRPHRALGMQTGVLWPTEVDGLTEPRPQQSLKDKVTRTPRTAWPPQVMVVWRQNDSRFVREVGRETRKGILLYF